MIGGVRKLAKQIGWGKDDDDDELEELVKREEWISVA